MLAPWAAGFVMYQLVNPGYVPFWVSLWGHVASWIGFAPAIWMSASIMSFAVAAVGCPARRLPGRTDRDDSAS